MYLWVIFLGNLCCAAEADVLTSSLSLPILLHPGVPGGAGTGKEGKDGDGDGAAGTGLYMLNQMKAWQLNQQSIIYVSMHSTAFTFVKGEPGGAGGVLEGSGSSGGDGMPIQ